VLVNTAGMSRNGFLKPIKPSAKPDGPKQPPPNLSAEFVKRSVTLVSVEAGRHRSEAKLFSRVKSYA
jgi:hypothetical protein